MSEDSIELDPVCEEQVHQFLNGINACKATGLDNMPAQFVTDASEIITSPLTHNILVVISGYNARRFEKRESSSTT